MAQQSETETTESYMYRLSDLASTSAAEVEQIYHENSGLTVKNNNKTNPQRDSRRQQKQ